MSYKRIIAPDQIEIDDEIYTVGNVIDFANGGMLIETECNKEFVVFRSKDTAGRAARDYWEDIAENDSEEFTCIVGEQTLVKWALGHSAGPGTAKVSCLYEWLDLHLIAPEEHFARYDHKQRQVSAIGEDLRSKIGFDATVAYRNN